MRRSASSTFSSWLFVSEKSLFAAGCGNDWKAKDWVVSLLRFEEAGATVTAAALFAPVSAELGLWLAKVSNCEAEANGSASPQLSWPLQGTKLGESSGL